MTGETLLQVSGTHTFYGHIEALKGIDLTVNRGEIVAFLGPNGAGKTTTLEILAGHRRRDAGEVRVLGFDPGEAPRDYRERIGIVPQETAVEPVLTTFETLQLYSAAYPKPLDVDEVLRLVGLQEQRESRVSALSGGQQRRLDLAIGIAGDPELLFLDEPTTGFDPAARRRSWDLIRHLRERGKTVLLTTHYMEEAQQLADRVAVMRRGEIVTVGTPAELTGGGAEAEIRYRRNGDAVVLRTQEPTRVLHELTAEALAEGRELEALEVRRPSLEDVYLSLTEE
jgi:ABC-2 type transport system ATP-binding protein